MIRASVKAALAATLAIPAAAAELSSELGREDARHDAVDIGKRRLNRFCRGIGPEWKTPSTSQEHPHALAAPAAQSR